MQIRGFLSVLLIAAGTAKSQSIPNMDVPIFDEVRFTVLDFPCELQIMPTDRAHYGLIAPEQPSPIRLQRGREYLVECESHALPVKLYARYHLFGRGTIENNPLPNAVVLHPVAVLPNLVKAVAAGSIAATTVADAAPVQCKRSGAASEKSNSRAEAGQIFADRTKPVIPKNTRVNLAATRPVFCGDTNLVEVSNKSGSTWYRNKDFKFEYGGKVISVYPPSQERDCCWIE